MKILWITNTIFPAPSLAIGLKPPVVGGWMYGLAEQVAGQCNQEFAVASCYSGKEVRKDVIEGITYYTIPFRYHNSYPKELEHYWKFICEDFIPDVVHIHGTEYAWGLACMKIHPYSKYVVSIQGMIGPCSRYVTGGISLLEQWKNITFRDILRGDTMLFAQKRWEKMGELEKEYYQRADIIIGRTSWDYARSKVINKTCNYQFCNESLRNEFYLAEKWKIELCTNYSIFVSQAGVPLKGLHKVLEAIQLLKDEFPCITIRIGGSNIISNISIKERIRMGGYGKYIKSLLRKYNLYDNVRFLGPLEAKEMIREYQSANVFLCPSSIENSPNSVGEAQIIGTPVVASYVGGTPDMIIHKESGLLYRFEEVEMLANFIREVFTNHELTAHLSQNAILTAKKRHDMLTNLNRLIEIYNSLACAK
ncbi:MAG: glycosyltransferase [Sphingobacteriia bacterium]|jgi:glycosyltransferase involved in cell wall biosynthesis|nr:glycosyltransferase [Sphingobacteriia bacterium]